MYMTKEEYRDYMREYRKTHPTWAHTHREERRAYFKEYYKNNKDKWHVHTLLSILLKEL